MGKREIIARAIAVAYKLDPDGDRHYISLGNTSAGMKKGAQWKLCCPATDAVLAALNEHGLVIVPRELNTKMEPTDE